MPVIDVEELIACVGRALPGAEPFAAVPLLLDQVQWLDAEAGRDLVERVVARSHPWTWEFDDDRLDRWPAPVADLAVEVVRALPPGDARFEALARIARRLDAVEQAEVMRGLVDGSFLMRSPKSSVPDTRRPLVVAFVRTLPAEAREVWVRSRVACHPDSGNLEEIRSRRDVDCLTEPALRALWERIPACPPPDIPSGYFRLASLLPPDLRSQALATIRACPDRRRRLHHLTEFDAELGDDERRAIVEGPPRMSPGSQAVHLWRVGHHLPKVASEVRRAWLDIVLANPVPDHRLRSLVLLLPSLSGAARTEAVAALLALLAEQNEFVVEERWDLVPDDGLTGFLLRLRDDPYAWHRDGLVAHVCTERSAETADRVLPLLLEGLREREADTCLEIVRALGPWLADRTAGAVPRALAALPVPVSETAPKADYMVTRVMKQG